MTKRGLAAGLVLAVVVVGACAAPDVSSASQDLPMVELHSDEDGPTDVSGAWDASELVVLATVGDAVAGAGFFGGDLEDLGPAQWVEAVELQLEDVTYLKGEGKDPLRIRWPMFLTSEKTSDARTGVLEMAGLRRDLPRGSTYLFFLTDHGEPWGLSGTTLGASALEVTKDLAVGANVASVFADIEGRPLVEVLPAGAADRLDG